MQKKTETVLAALPPKVKQNNLVSYVPLWEKSDRVSWREDDWCSWRVAAEVEKIRAATEDKKNKTKPRFIIVHSSRKILHLLNNTHTHTKHKQTKHYKKTLKLTG